MTRRTFVVVATAVAVVAAIGGFAAAALLSSTTVPSHRALYEGSSTPDPNFPTAPALTPTNSIQATVTSCTTSGASMNYPGRPGTNYQVQVAFAASVGGGTCAQGDFFEEFLFTSPTTGVAESTPFSLTTTYGTAPSTDVFTFTATSTVWSSSLGGTPTLAIWVDYGTVAPQGGIAALSVLVE